MIYYIDLEPVLRGLLGTPYSKLDCINLVKYVIRHSPGGIKNYTDAGTNSLWKSYNSSGKYRHLIERYNDISHAKAGWFLFKASGENVHHVGIMTQDYTVIHSSSVAGKVIEENLKTAKGWNRCGKSKYIITGD